MRKLYILVLPFLFISVCLEAQVKFTTQKTAISRHSMADPPSRGNAARPDGLQPIDVLCPDGNCDSNGGGDIHYGDNNGEVPGNQSGSISSAFHDTQGSIEVSGGGQLQFTLPIALPPGVKSVAPQMNLVYTSGGGNGIAGYGWSLSGITNIARMSKTIEKDGSIKGIQLDNTDFFSFNGQRLLLKSGVYGSDGAEYLTEKFSNVKVKSVGTTSGNGWSGPEYWEVTFEDGSQAWYGQSSDARTPVEYNITKWKDAQGNYITYNYSQSNNVSAITSIAWGGNENLGKTHFNQINFYYSLRDLVETSYVNGVKFLQNKVLNSVEVQASGSQFKKYQITHTGSDGYPKVSLITEYNSQGEGANPVSFEYQPNPVNTSVPRIETSPSNANTRKYGDFDYDGITDFIEMGYNGVLSFKKSVYIDSTPININYNTSEFSEANFRDAAIISYKNNNVVGENAGIVIPVKKNRTDGTGAYDFELRIYAVNLQSQTLDFKYAKTLLYEQFKSSGEGEPIDEPNCHIYPSEISRITSYDYDGDGISEILLNFRYERHCYTDDLLDPGYLNKKANDESVSVAKNEIEGEQENVFTPSFALRHDNTQVPSTLLQTESRETEGNHQRPVGFQYNNIIETSTVFFDLKQEIPYDQSYFKFNFGSNGNNTLDAADFNGDGIEELYRDQGNSLQYFYNIKRDMGGNYSLISMMNSITLPGMPTRKIMGDFNGDGKADMAIPLADKTSNWKFYLSTGKGFDAYDYNNFIYFSASQEKSDEGIHHRFPESGCSYGTFTYYQYQATDLDQDGKSEIVVNKVVMRNHLWNAHSDQEYTNVSLFVYSPSKPASVPAVGSTTMPFSFGNTLNYIPPTFSQKVISFQPLFINKTNRQIILLGTPDDCPSSNCTRLHVIYLDYKHIPTSTRIKAITQGKLTTNIEYAELLPGNQYRESSPMLYPFMALNRVNKSYVVSSLVQEVRRQDFRYKGLVSHLHGRGMVGFRQTARSSWYSNSTYNTIIWSGAEMDPLQEGVPIKEWSIKTNDENQIFPVDISLTNAQLLSFKSTQYRNDDLPNGVKALVPITTISKDFQRDITTTSTIGNYNEYYLPTQTVTNVNNGFAIITTNLEYLHNPGGSGSSYYIGRPKSKMETVQAYGDSKGAKEDYEYENNLLKSKTSWNQTNTGWVKETYAYDGFGNTISKTISNSIDANTQNEQAEYEPTGRFVIKKTDNLGLKTTISYNDWGQILEQTDPLGNQLTNTYDGWGKLMTAHTNLGGTSTYKYEKFYNGDTRVTEYLPDRQEKATYTDKLGQNYKIRTKALMIGRYVSKDTQYDELGRKTAESEPYFEDDGPDKWSTIEYDTFSRPVKATSFTGKVVESTYDGRVATMTETNANNRFKKQTSDPLGNIVTSEDKGGIINFKFNATGQVTEAKYGANIVTTKYDEWGRKAEFYDPSNGQYKYQYNAFGQLVKETSPKGYKEYTYNALGQLITQRELTTDGTQNTDKTISYSYNNKGMVTGKSGTSKGKSFSSSIAYDNYGRALETTENSNGKTFTQKSLIYDAKGRVTSYEKGLLSSGTYTKVNIENVYDIWSGQLIQVRDKNSGKTLWELKEANARGQVTQAKLGAATILNMYDQNGFLSNTSHTAPNRTILQVGYSFNAIKNELNSRTTGGDFNISESFNYDENNRLVSWTNPRTGTLSSNGYDAEGRIRQNDMLGRVGFGGGQSVYQATSVTLNAAGQQNLTNNMVQQIVYNENNDPVFIDGVRGDARFEYGLTEMRQMATYGGNFAVDGEGKFTKYYSEDGSFEVIRNNQTGEEKHTLYIGGSPYESSILFVKNYAESAGSYKFLHKDYLGSILAISDEAGNKIEQRHYDAWGNLTHLQVNGGAIITDENQIRDLMAGGTLVTERGYTSHEHFAEVGLIHMNGRLYDPLLRRFLNADENIQDPYNTQNYNKYGYVLNNPLMYNDPSGELFWFAALVPIVGKFFAAVIAGAIGGAIIGTAMYLGQAAITGNFSWGGLAKSFFVGAFTGAVAGGLGQVFSGAGFWATVGNGALAGAGSGGIKAIVSGQNFFEGLIKGAVIGGAMGAVSWVVSKTISYYKSKTPQDITESELEQQGYNVSNSNNDYYTKDSQIHNDFNRTTGDYQSSVNNINTEFKLATAENLPEGYHLTSSNQIWKNDISKPGNVLGITFGRNKSWWEFLTVGEKSTVLIAPNVGLKVDVVKQAVFGHEFIHAYHTYLGFPAHYGNNYQNFTESSAYHFSINLLKAYNQDVSGFITSYNSFGGNFPGPFNWSYAIKKIVNFKKVVK